MEADRGDLLPRGKHTLIPGELVMEELAGVLLPSVHVIYGKWLKDRAQEDFLRHILFFSLPSFSPKQKREYRK